MEKVLEDERGKEIHREWKGLLTSQGKTASKRAFMATQLPEEWIAKGVLNQTTGVITGDPMAILQHERDRLAELWKAEPTEADFGWQEPYGGNVKLPRMTPEMIRAASMAFPKKTSWTYDGFHPRHYAILSASVSNAWSDSMA